MQLTAATRTETAATPHPNPPQIIIIKHKRLTTLNFLQFNRHYFLPIPANMPMIATITINAVTSAVTMP